MTAAETAWEPGDPNPFVPDNGCGTVPQIYMNEDTRATVIAEDDGTPPPWWRPGQGTNPGYTRTCKPCGVGWRGDDPCWMCGGQESP